MNKKIVIITTEPSGDVLGSELMDEFVNDHNENTIKIAKQMEEE